MSVLAKATTKPTTTVIRRQFEGEVVSAAASKTIRVRVRATLMHHKYRKQYARSRTYPVHDEKAAAQVGNRVIFQECRPLSKTKRWRLISVVNQDVTVRT